MVKRPLSQRALEAARRVLAGVAQCAGPVAAARLLPPGVYGGEEFWEFKKEAVFGRAWLCSRHVNEIPDPGHQLPLTIFAEPLTLDRRMPCT